MELTTKKNTTPKTPEEYDEWYLERYEDDFYGILPPDEIEDDFEGFEAAPEED
jgi:hypothetical protein